MNGALSRDYADSLSYDLRPTELINHLVAHTRAEKRTGPKARVKSNRFPVAVSRRPEEALTCLPEPLTSMRL